MREQWRGGLIAATLLWSGGCGGMERSVSEPAAQMELDLMAKDEAGPPPPPAQIAAGAAGFAANLEMDGDIAGEKVERKREEGRVASKTVDAEEQNRPTEPEDPAGGEGEAERTRSWFPDAFLWQPEVVTNEQGTAELEVTVPDQLTTWRVLALAHDKRGQQAGSVHLFDGTLPLYVDPVVPGWLYAGDRVVLPVQVVNTTAESVPATVTVEAQGAMTGTGTAQLILGPAGSDVRTLPFDVVGSGAATVTARLASAQASDAAERTIPVIPAGRPVETQRGGTLAVSRSFHITSPEGADPTTEEVEVLVFPGALSVLQLELERLAAGARPEGAAYGFALTGSIAPLAAAAHVELDDALMRKMRILAWQRVVPASRTPDPGTMADLLASLRFVTDHPQAQDLVPRLRQGLQGGQRADGTWSRTDRSTLQRVLVDTAAAARVLPEDARGPRLRAAAAIERYLHEVKDPYTASVLLASGLVEGDTAGALTTLLVDAIGKDENGEPTIAVPAGVSNPWGTSPTRAELLAWVVLALPADNAERGDFAAQLMQGWSASNGFGAGRGDVVALEAVTKALGGVSGPIDLTLDFDGVVVATATLDPSQPKVPARLQGHPTSPDAEINVHTSQGVPGLAFVATRRSYVPWTEADQLSGVELGVEGGALRVGQETLLQLTAVAPSGTSLRIEQPLPSGVLVGEDAAQRVAELGATLQVLTDRVVIVTRPFEPGEILSLSLPVTPSFAGHFQTAPVLVSADGGRVVPLKPLVWTVGGGAGS